MSRTPLPRRLWRGLALLRVPAVSQAIEEPGYEVLHLLGDSVEIRRYAAYVVAEVLIADASDEAGKQAFPILAGYIFGKNKGERKFAMTAARGCASSCPGARAWIRPPSRPTRSG